MIYSLACHSKCVWLPFLCETQCFWPNIRYASLKSSQVWFIVISATLIQWKCNFICSA